MIALGGYVRSCFCILCTCVLANMASAIEVNMHEQNVGTISCNTTSPYTGSGSVFRDVTLFVTNYGSGDVSINGEDGITTNLDLAVTNDFYYTGTARSGAEPDTQIIAGKKNGPVYGISERIKITHSPPVIEGYGSDGQHDSFIVAGGLNSSVHTGGVVITYCSSCQGGVPIEVGFNAMAGVSKNAYLVVDSTRVDPGAPPLTFNTDENNKIYGVVYSSDISDNSDPASVTANGASHDFCFSGLTGDPHSSWTSSPARIGTATNYTIGLTARAGPNLPLAGHDIAFFVEKIEMLDANGAYSCLTNTVENQADLSEYAAFLNDSATCNGSGYVYTTLNVNTNVQDLLSVTVAGYDYSVWSGPGGIDPREGHIGIEYTLGIDDISRLKMWDMNNVVTSYVDSASTEIPRFGKQAGDELYFTAYQDNDWYAGQPTWQTYKQVWVSQTVNYWTNYYSGIGANNGTAEITQNPSEMGVYKYVATGGISNRAVIAIVTNSILSANEVKIAYNANGVNVKLFENGLNDITNGIVWCLATNYPGASINANGILTAESGGVYRVRAAVSGYTDYWYDEMNVRVLKVELASTNGVIAGNAPTNAVFNIKPSSWTNLTWSIQPYGDRSARFADSSTGAGLNVTTNGTNAWVSAGSDLQSYIIRASAKEDANAYDEAVLTVMKELTVTDNPDSGGTEAETTDPINLMTGNQTIDTTDIAIPCPGFDLVFSRHYNSAAPNIYMNDMGRGWTHNYQWSLTNSVEFDGSAIVNWKVLRTGDGQTFKFRDHGNDTYTAPYGSLMSMSKTGAYLRVNFPAGTYCLFNSDGTINAMADAWGNSLNFEYGYGWNNCRLYRVSHSCGKSLLLEYDPWRYYDELVGVSTDDQDYKVEFDYEYVVDPMNSVQMIESRIYTSSGAETTRYEWTNGLLAKKISPLGYTFDYTYTTNRYGVTNKGASVLVASNYYDHTVSYVASNKSTVTYSRGDITQCHTYVFNPNTLELGSITGPNTNSIGREFGYDGSGNTTSELAFIANKAEYIRTSRLFDAQHHVTNEATAYNTASLTNNWRYQWDANYSLVTNVVSPNGRRTSFVYTNGLPSVSKVFYGASASYDTLFAYTTNGLLSAVTNANGNCSRFYYDNSGFKTSSVSATGLRADYKYTPIGVLTNITLPGGRTTVFEADQAGRVSKITYPDGLSESFGYDVIGNMICSTDRMGRISTMTYLPTRKLSSVVRALSGGQAITNSYLYDKQFNTLMIRDNLGRKVESYKLDEEDRPISITNLEGQAMSIAYGIGGMVKQITRFDNTTVTNTFNSQGLISKTIYPGLTNNFTYLADGMLSSVSGGVSTLRMGYDLVGRTTNIITFCMGYGPTNTAVLGYNPVGSVKNIAIIGLKRGVGVGYTFDADERVTGIMSTGGVFNLVYNSTNGLLSQVVNTNSGIQVAYLFDVMDRATNITYRSSSNTVIASYAYMYNNSGMITNQSSVLCTQSTVRAFSYDDLDRLVYETSTGVTNFTNTYSFDLAGNRTNAVLLGITNRYTLGTGNRLASWVTNGITNLVYYGTNGCVTNFTVNRVTNNLTWDGRYLLTDVSTNKVAAQRNGYDALGRRAWSWDGSETNYFIYSGNQIIADVDATGGVLRAYVWGTGVDNLLAMTVYTGTVAQTYYAIKDHLGSIQAMVDSNGTVVEQYSYDAWGKVLSIKNGSGTAITKSAIGNRVLWQGREYSYSTGLYYFRARWYEPITGRWLSNDPIGISGGLNQYVFCGDNPINFVDPFGLRDVVIQFYSNLTAAELPDAAKKEVERIYLDAFNKYGKTKEHTLKFEWKDSEKCPGDTGYSGGNLFGFNPTQARFFIEQANDMRVMGYNPRRWNPYINAKGIREQSTDFNVGMGVVIAHETGLHGIANKTDLSGANANGFVDTSLGAPSSGSPVFSPGIGKAIMDALDLN